MNERQLAKLDKDFPEQAVAALNAAQQRLSESGFPYVVVIDGGLYRVSADGTTELLRKLEPRTQSNMTKTPEAKSPTRAKQ